MKYKIAADSILRVQAGEGWVLSNPRSRRHVELDRAGLSAVAYPTQAKPRTGHSR